MAAIAKRLVVALCALSGVQALNMDLRIGSGGRTLHDFRREVSFYTSLSPLPFYLTIRKQWAQHRPIPAYTWKKQCRVTVLQYGVISTDCVLNV